MIHVNDYTIPLIIPAPCPLEQDHGLLTTCGFFKPTLNRRVQQLHFLYLDISDLSSGYIFMFAHFSFLCLL
ncbi:hypothetical protein BDW59DRAFT_152149 [Aspergillus cavernicola]|uniref:Uncharacterized protein n=1 Tax=Aspergillus cavernicola TaxID=176166 RepID=A0ABR4HSW2_9EURO